MDGERYHQKRIWVFFICCFTEDSAVRSLVFSSCSGGQKKKKRRKYRSTSQGVQPDEVFEVLFRVLKVPVKEKCNQFLERKIMGWSEPNSSAINDLNESEMLQRGPGPISL